MRMEDVKVGRWYETSQGLGECLGTTGAGPLPVAIRLRLPGPSRRTVYLAPADLIRELPMRPRGQQ